MYINAKKHSGNFSGRGKKRRSTAVLRAITG
jgi:hypothetical protein